MFVQGCVNYSKLTVILNSLFWNTPFAEIRGIIILIVTTLCNQNLQPLSNYAQILKSCIHLINFINKPRIHRHLELPTWCFASSLVIFPAYFIMWSLTWSRMSKLLPTVVFAWEVFIVLYIWDLKSCHFLDWTKTWIGLQIQRQIYSKSS